MNQTITTTQLTNTLQLFGPHSLPQPSPSMGEGKDGGAAHAIEILGTPTFFLPHLGGGFF
jgi:hypothetical protein